MTQNGYSSFPDLFLLFLWNLCSLIACPILKSPDAEEQRKKVVLSTESELASKLILGAAATSFSWVSVDAFIHPTLMHRTPLLWNELTQGSEMALLSKNSIARGVWRKMTTVTPIWFSDMKICVSVDLYHTWTLFILEKKINLFSCYPVWLYSCFLIEITWKTQSQFYRYRWKMALRKNSRRERQIWFLFMP